MADDPEKTAETDPDPETVARLNRIVTLTQNGRATWFGYLGALAFSALTLLSVEDKDFFTADASTQLPIVNFAVPTTAFFSAGALLIALTYGYLHVFLEKLWRELGRVEARINGDPVADHIHPWIVSDFALRLRRAFQHKEHKERGERAPIPWSPLGIVSNVASFLMCWVSGPFVMGWFWIRSMPAHEAWLTVWLGILLAATVATFGASLATLVRHMAPRSRFNKPHFRRLKSRLRTLKGWRQEYAVDVLHRRSWWRRLWRRRGRDFAVFAVLCLALYPVSLAKTIGNPLRTTDMVSAEAIDLGDRTEILDDIQEYSDAYVIPQNSSDPRNRLRRLFAPARADMTEVNLTELPADWLTYDVARRDAFQDWCGRPDTMDCSGLAGEDAIEAAMATEAFQSEWLGRRETYLRVLQKPVLRGRNLRRAQLGDIHMPGIDLREADLTEAFLEGAQLEGANFSAEYDAVKGTYRCAADLRGADLSGAKLQFARLNGAIDIRAGAHDCGGGTYATGVNLQGANLSQAQMQGADLWGAQMQGAILRWAEMQGADLRRAEMQGADLREAQMQGADLSVAEMQGAVLSEAEMQGADLSAAEMQGADLRRAQMQGAVLRWAEMQGADLSAAEMQGADLRGAQMQGAVLRRAQMQGADLRRAQMQGADLRRAQMQGAVLSVAQMQGAVLSQAEMQGADLSYSLLTGSAETPILLKSTKLIAGTNDGGAIRFVDFTDAALAFADFRNSFADGSVVTPPEFRRPCQWLTRRAADDSEFFGIWRGWVEASPSAPDWDERSIGLQLGVAPEGFEDIPPIPPAKDCAWVEDVPMPMGP